MRKLTVALVVAVSLATTACAHNPVGSALLGGVIGYSLAQPRVVYAQPAPAPYYGYHQYNSGPTHNLGHVCPGYSTPVYQMNHTGAYVYQGCR